MEAGLGSLDPNVLPLDAFTVDTSTLVLGTRDGWVLGSAQSGAAWVSGRSYIVGDVVYRSGATLDGYVPKLIYVCIQATSSVAPDFTNATSNTYWEWVAGTAVGYVAGRGWWEKHADGTLEQWGNNALYQTTLQNSAVGIYGWSYYYGVANMNYPIPFYSDPSSVIVSSSRDGRTGFCHAHNIGTSQVLIASFGDISVTAKFDWIAIGRWRA